MNGDSDLTDRTSRNKITRECFCLWTGAENMQYRKELMVLCYFILKGQVTNQDYYRSIHNMASTEAILKAALLTPVMALSLHRSLWQQKNSKLSSRKESAISFTRHWDFFQQEKVLNLPMKQKKIEQIKRVLTVTPFWYGERSSA